MSSSDLLIDRKRLKRRLTFWRALAVLCVFGVVAFVGLQMDPKRGGSLSLDYIAEIELKGIMGDSPDRDELFEKIEKDDHAKALLVRMDSPGGTAVAGEEVYLQLKKIAKKKPVVGVMRTLCASACYMAAMGTDHVIARDGTLTGSIGVMMQAAEFSRLAEKLGITPITIKSGEFKDAPSFTEPFTPEQRAVVSQVVMDAYDHFVRIIASGRKMDEARVRELADGRVYTGSQAEKLKLIDGIGGQDEAIEWLAKNRKINPKLEVREIESDPEFDSVFKKLGFMAQAKLFGNSTVGLDGLVSIWHPSLQ
jgi:protease-4